MSGHPLRSAALAFVAGAGLGAWLPQEPTAWGWAAAAALAFWAALLATRRDAAASRAGLLVFVCAGIFRLQADLKPLYAPGEQLVEGDAVVAGRIARPAEQRQGESLLHLEEVRLRRDGVTVRLDRPLQIVLESGFPEYAVGDRVTARGRFRAIRGDRNLGWFPGPVVPRGRRYAARLVVASAAWMRCDGRDPGHGPGAAVLRWRGAADSFWKSRPGAAGAILNALTTGERAGIPAQAQEAFLRSGLTHLLAISGMNVGFLAALVFLALRWLLALSESLALRWPVQPIAAALTLPALWFFMLFSGGQIPVARAVLSGAAGLAAVVLWRRAAAADAWAVAGLALVAGDPPVLFSASFQLSFAAVAALLLVAPRISSVGSHDPCIGAGASRPYRYARSLFTVSVAASAATAPLVAFHFQQVSLVGPVANLLAVPFAGLVVLPAGWLTLAAQALGEPAGAAVAPAALWSAERLVDVATWFAAPPWAVTRTSRPPALLTISLLALTVAALTPGAAVWNRARVGTCAAAAVAATGWVIATHGAGMLVAVLDVGQGLATAVVLPGGGSLLFDAGPRWRDFDAGARVVVPALRRLGVARLGTLAISHEHPDHDGGAGAVLRELGAQRIWRGSGPQGLSRGDEPELTGGVGVQVLNPPAGSPGGEEAADINDRSLALLLSLGGTGVVLTGDAGPAVAAGLGLAARPPPHLALQAPHHGGSPEACRLLGDVLRPEVSVISVGRNRYGHPRPGAVAALEAQGRVLRTDRDGAVLIRSDGSRLEVRTWRGMSGGRTWAERLRWLVAGW